MASEADTKDAPSSARTPDSDLTRTSGNQPKLDNQDVVDDTHCDVSRGGETCNSTTTHLDNSSKHQQEGLTKNQLRKLKRRQMWEKKKEQRLQLRREKRQERRRKKHEAHITEKAEEQPQRSEVIPKSRKRKKRMSDPDASDVRVVIDCGFDDLMQEGDVTKLSKQIQRSYASNRTSDKPFQFYICNFGDKTKARFQSGLKEHPSWDVNFSEQGLNDLFSKDSIVYLTSESPKVLKELDAAKVYVIGGLVDHNHHKGVCYQRAVSEGWDHAQLPIAEYMKFNSRKVLTVNHVFEILVAYIETKDWKAAFDRVVPQRKFHTLSRRERRRRAHRKVAERHDGSKDKAPVDGQEVEEQDVMKDKVLVDRQDVEGHDGSEDEMSSDGQEEAGHDGNEGSSSREELAESGGGETENQTETEKYDKAAKFADTAQENSVTL